MQHPKLIERFSQMRQLTANHIMQDIIFFYQPGTSCWVAQHLPLILVMEIFGLYDMVGQRRCKRTLWHSGMEELWELINDSRWWTLSLSGQALGDKHVVHVSCQLLSRPTLFTLSKKMVDVLVKHPSKFLLISTIFSATHTVLFHECNMIWGLHFSNKQVQNTMCIMDELST